MSVAVSVVIPTYNRAADLCRALASVQRQTWRDWEAIVVDNHSEDGTRAAVERLQDARIRLIEIHNDGIVARSRNAGIRAAAGEYVAFLDSDDWWKARKLERSLQALRSGADVVYHDLLIVRSEGQRFHLRRARTRALAPPVYEDLIRNGNALNNSSVVVRRSLLEQIGGLSEERALIALEDYDAWLRLARFTQRFLRLPVADGYYWQGGANLLTPERSLQTMSRVAERYLQTDLVAGRATLPPWMQYVIGRAHYHLGSHALAVEHMRRALRGGLPANQNVKAVLTLAISLGRSRFSSV